MNIINQNPNPLGLDMALKPGVITFFGSVNELPEWERYFSRLSMSAMRRNFEVERVATDRMELLHTTVARRYNIGNLAVKAYAWISAAGGPIASTASLEPLFDLLTDVEDWSTGSIEVAAIYHECFDFAPQSSPTRLQHSAEIAEEAVWSKRSSIGMTPMHEKTAEETAIAKLEAQRAQVMNQIGLMIASYVRQFHEMPPIDQLMANMSSKFIVDPRVAEGYSPVIVNGDLNIVLPNYNEIVLDLTPLTKILYLLFLMHPEGIVLKDIDSYAGTLVELYSLVKPGGNDERAMRSIDEMCRPGSESLNQKLSMIRRDVKVQLQMPQLVDYYSINGAKGEPYRLKAAACCQLPQVLRAMAAD